MKRILALTITTFAFFWTLCASAEGLSLMQMIAPWQYPDSTMHGAAMADGATVDANGERTTQSIVCKAVMTTDTPVEKVLDYYKTKLTPAPPKKDKDAKTVDPGGRSVVFNDDSDGRPFAMHTIIVITNDTSTTLVITRGKDESKTHIAWKHYRRINP